MASETPITSFSGGYGFLSNFHQRLFKYNGYEYRTAEHAFQAAKTREQVWFYKIVLATSPREAKRLGRLAPKRQDWEDIRVDIMLDILRAKFKDPVLRHQLLATGNRLLIEGNTWNDTFWGICKGVGENMLGKCLMSVRAEIRTELSGRSHG